MRYHGNKLLHSVRTLTSKKVIKRGLLGLWRRETELHASLTNHASLKCQPRIKRENCGRGVPAKDKEGELW